MKMLVLAWCLLAVSATTARAAALWQRYPEVLCRGETSQMCQLPAFACKLDESPLLLEIDFKIGTVNVLNANNTRKIIDKYFFDSGDTKAMGLPDSNVIQIEDGVRIAFNDDKPAVRPHRITAIWQDSSGSTTFTTLLTCEPGVRANSANTPP